MSNRPKAKKATTSRIQISSKPNEHKLKAKAILSKIGIILDDCALKDRLNVNETITPSINGNSTFDVPYIAPPKAYKSLNEGRKLATVRPGKYRKGKSFMTDVGLVLKRKGEGKGEDDGYMKCVNEKVDEIISNIQSIDDHSEIVRLNDNTHLSKVEKEGRDFRQLLNDIDECKNQMQEEFDEVKYLIKFADNTHKLIGRHKNVMTNIFREAGLRPKVEQLEAELDPLTSNNKAVKKRGMERNEANDSFNRHHDYAYDRNKGEDLGEVFNKLKKINKIKDNLCNIQDDFFGYHQRLKDKFKSNH